MQNKQWLMLVVFIITVMQCIAEGRVSCAGRMMQEYIKNPSLFHYSMYYLLGTTKTVVSAKISLGNCTQTVTKE